MNGRRGITADEAAAHMRHYLGLPTGQMRGLQATLIEAHGNPDLLAALTQELARRDDWAVTPTPTEENDRA